MEGERGEMRDLSRLWMMRRPKRRMLQVAARALDGHNADTEEHCFESVQRLHRHASLQIR